MAAQPKTPSSTKAVKSKVKRYWPGKKPSFNGDNVSSDEEENIEHIKIEDNSQRSEKKIPVRLGAEAEASRNRRRNVAEIVLINKDHNDKTGDDDIEMPQIKEEEATAETEEDVEARRARVRDRLKKRCQEQNEHEMADEREKIEIKKEPIDESMVDLNEDGSEQENDEEDSSEYTTDSEDESGAPQMLKPVFVPKTERETIAEREKLEEAEEALKKEEQRLRDERKKDTKRLVAEEIKKEESSKIEASKSDDEDDGVDSDGDAEKEYSAWKIREMKRIKREKEEREAAEKELLEIERRRNMTDEERKREDEILEKLNNEQKKDHKKLKFLQKYYHKGAFYQDVDADKRSQIATIAVGEDQFHKENLPSVMQVKNFGRSGRTKYTHLVDQDTTNGRENPWFMVDTLKKQSHRLGGTGDTLGRPSFKRKR